MTLMSIYIYQVFNQIRSCSVDKNCPGYYISLTDACYCFTLLFAVLFSKHFSLCSILNDTLDDFIYANEHISKNYQFKCFSQIVMINALIFVDLLRKCIMEYDLFDFNSLNVWIFVNFIRNLIYSVDAFIVSFFAILEMNMQCVNEKIKGTLVSRNPENYFNFYAQLHWKFTTTIKKTVDYLGPILFITLVFKQIQIIGMIYFTLLNYISDLGNNLFQAFDLLLPAVNFIWICFSSSQLTEEAKQCMFIFQDLKTVNVTNLELKQKIEYFQELNHYRGFDVNANNFFVVRLGLIIKVVSVTLTYVVAVVQMIPTTSNLKH
ncbi:uncharacterized protein LOC106664369 [Cimex lectularius]|uniref:Gustatory receptor n=1 Tax=Cimex lectularius TaxID=79782 RepID=A0A8I6RKR3_CIMLE|nr:uncharacterized protein LOC106664369 [Cimex lectularius]